MKEWNVTFLISLVIIIKKLLQSPSSEKNNQSIFVMKKAGLQAANHSELQSGDSLLVATKMEYSYYWKIVLDSE